VDRLEVRWANGATVAYDVPGVDRFLVIDQARGRPRYVIEEHLTTPSRPGQDRPAA